MRYFITGATGFIGERLAVRLAGKGHTVHALVRDKRRAGKLTHPNIRLFDGDLLNSKKMEAAIKGCDFAFHLAAYARVWSKDKEWPRKVNVEGTANLLKLAHQHKLKRMIFTSTGGTLEPSDGQTPVAETTARTVPYFNAYEHTKAEAEKLSLSFVDKGLEIVIVNPTRVYGPGLISESNAMTKIIKQFNKGKWRIIPGDGNRYGNYVFVEDVVNGHLLAMEKGKNGQRYIIGGENITYNGFFQKLRQVTGKQQRLFHMPFWMMYLGGSAQYWFSQLTGQPPLITPKWIEKYLHHWAVSSKKAEMELGYSITSLDEGLKKTVDWLNEKSE